MAALTEEIYGTIADIEGGISNDKNDIGNYIGGNKKGTFVPTKYGVTFDWWYKNIKNKTGVPKESEKIALIDEFNNSVKNSTDAKNLFEEVFYENPKGRNLSLKGIDNPATAAFVLDAMINQNFAFNNTNANNIYEAIKKAGGTNTGDIVKDINSVNQAEFRKAFLDVRVDRYNTSKTAKNHMKGWMKRLDDLSDTWADKGESSLLNPDFNFQDNISGKPGDYKYVDREAIEDSEKIKTVVPPGPDKFNVNLSIEEKSIIEKGREEEKKDELIKRDAEANNLEDSINRGLNKIGSSQLSPEFVRNVQEGNEQVYDEDVKNAIDAMDPDNPFAIYEGKEVMTDSAGNLTVVVPGIDKSGLQPITFEEIQSIQMGPEYQETEEEAPVEDEPIVVSDDVLDYEPEEIEEEEEEIEIFKPKPKVKEEEKEKKAFPWRNMANAGLGLLAGAMGRKHMKEALKDLPIQEGHQLDAAWKDYMSKMKEMSQSGLSAQEKTVAKSELSKSFNLGVKNVMRGAGGSRAAFLANVGVLNANRVEGLLKLTALDAATHRKNLQQYGTALKYQQEHDRHVDSVDKKMQYAELKRKADINAGLGNGLIAAGIESVNYAINKNANPVTGAMNNMTQTLLDNQQLKSDTTNILNMLNNLNK
tara:strand:+ start:5023 stop:6957 length:1935 start_codon:yes stop_codon:yes gene_type:complete